MDSDEADYESDKSSMPARETMRAPQFDEDDSSKFCIQFLKQLNEAKNPLSPTDYNTMRHVIRDGLIDCKTNEDIIAIYREILNVVWKL